MARNYDLLVIGGGSGGLAAAKRASAHGARTALVEPHPLGGTCVNVGCIPKKVMWNAAGVAETLEEAPGYGFEVGETRLDWKRLVEARANYIDRLNEIHRTNLDGAEVDLIPGWARFLDGETVAVDDQRFTADHFLIATGGYPRVPDMPGAELGITSDDFFELTEQPRRVAVVGGGYIAVELAGVLKSLGSEVTMVLRRDQVLSGFDPLMRETLTEEMAAAGVGFRTGIEAREVAQQGQGKYLNFPGGEELGPFDEVLWAIGRTPNVAGLALERTGVELGQASEVAVDDYQNTNVPGIYALGDVTGRVELTPVAIGAGRALADRVFGGQPEAHLDYNDIPSVVFSHPPIGSVGLAEDEAAAQYGTDGYRVYTTTFTDIYYALLERKVKTAMKVLTAGPEERLVGIHVIGRSADEMIQGFATLLKAGGTLDDLHRTVAIHPTAAEELVLIG